MPFLVNIMYRCVPLRTPVGRLCNECYYRQGSLVRTAIRTQLSLTVVVMHITLVFIVPSVNANDCDQFSSTEMTLFLIHEGTHS